MPIKPIDMMEKTKPGDTVTEVDPFANNAGGYTWRYLKDGRSRRTGQTLKLQVESKKRKWYSRPMIMTLILVFLTYTVLVRGRSFDYAGNREMKVVSCTDPVDGSEISLTLYDLAYYVIKVERDGNLYALEYDAENPKAYWNLYMNDEGDDSGYMSDLGRRAALQYAIRDTLYAHEAKRHGFNLNEVQQKETREAALEMYRSLTDRERSVCNYTDEDLYKIMEKERLAHEYMLYLAGEGDGTAFENVALHLNVGGSDYEEMYERYQISINEKLWNKVRIGFVTIN